MMTTNENTNDLLDSPCIARGPTPRDALAELEPYALLSIAASHHRHHHGALDDDGCMQADVVVVIERAARRTIWLWNSADGQIERVQEGDLVDCDEREAANGAPADEEE